MTNKPTAVPTSPVSLDRVLPHAEAAERAVLGAVLLSPEEAGRDVLDTLTVDHFYFARHQTIYREFQALRRANQTIDPVVVVQRLADAQLLEEIGGPAYFADLSSSIPALSNLEDYVRLVQDKATLRRIIGLNARALEAAFTADDVPHFVDQLEKETLAITTSATDAGETATLQHGSALFMESLAARLDVDSNGVTGISYGLGKLDKYTAGIHSEFTLIAARPSVGKTVLLMDIARHAALALGIPTAVFSLEMSLEQLTERTYSAEARVNSHGLRTGQISIEEHTRLLQAHAVITKAPLYIDDTPGLDILELRRRARRLVRKNGVRLVLADYAQLIKSNSRRAQNSEVTELNEVSNGLKNLQRELAISLIAAAQLNRDVEKRGKEGKSARPKLADLKGCGSFEQDADTVFLLHRDKDAETREERAKTELIIAKQRHGPLGIIPLVYREQYYRFESAAE